MRLYYLGPEGTHSHEAAESLAHCLHIESVDMVPLSSIEQLIKTVVNSENPSDAGCIPLENSLQGSVTMTWDTLGRFARLGQVGATGDAELMATWNVPIRHRLLTQGDVDLSLIQSVYSHPQALAQCQGWLQEHLPNATQIPVASTAEGAKHVSIHKGDEVAAVGSIAAASVYQLRYSTVQIQDSGENETRFGCLGKTDSPWSNALRASSTSGTRESISALLTGIPNTPGGLLSALVPFQHGGLNITRIESRPVGKRLGEYMFYVDVELRIDEEERLSSRWDAVVQTLQAQDIQVYPIGRLFQL